MKNKFREWAFNLFTKRITVKVAKLPDDARIEFLVNKLMNELVEQGHDIKGSPSGHAEYLALYGTHKGEILIYSHQFNLTFKRLTKV